MDSLAHLRAALVSTLTPNGPRHGEQELFDELNESRQQLTRVFDVGPRNAQEQRELSSGKMVVEGRQLVINPDFARQVTFLSEQLDCSERYCAGVMHSVVTENPNLNPVAAVEKAIVRHHQRRRDLAECLRLIFEACEVSQTHDPPQVFRAIAELTMGYLIPPTDSAKTGPGLAIKIFNEIDKLANELVKTQNAKLNAKSETVIPEPGRPGALAQDILDTRIEYLKAERRTLATSIFLIFHLNYFSRYDLERCIEWLSNNPNHAITYYILTAAIVAFNTVDQRKVRAENKADVMTTALPFCKKKLDPVTSWKDPALKAVVLLGWSMYLTDRRLHDDSLEESDGFRADQLEAYLWNAVQSDAFQYMLLVTLRLQRSLRSSLPSSFAKQLALRLDAEGLPELPDSDFKLPMLEAFEGLLRDLITNALSELRKIKQRQEDLVLTTSRADRGRAGSVRPGGVRFAPANDQRPPRNDIAVLFAFVGALYTALPPDSALQYWGAQPSQTPRTSYLVLREMVEQKLPSFLQWAVWSTQARDPDMSTALYDLLSGLSKGPQCSELAYNFMARGAGEVIPGSNLPSSHGNGYSSVPMVSWNTIFGLLESWAEDAANSRPQLPLPPAQPSHQPWQQGPPPLQWPTEKLVLSVKDVYLADAFLRLLAVVVAHSPPVRAAIYSHVQFRAIPTLLSLIPLSVPLELKGAVFETLSAFCLPGAGMIGVDTCKNVWLVMERQEIINVRGSRMSLAAVRGVEVELDEVEAVYKQYPVTIAFLKLLSTLIHTPKRIPLKTRMIDGEPTNTIPDNLGGTYRLPGIGPFVNFVLDNVFTRIPSREYQKLTDRLQLNDLCLCFMERCLASYELESLFGVQSGDSRLKPESLANYLVHPGFEIMKRLLTNTPIQTTILSFITECLGELDRGNTDHEPFLSSMATRVMRIILRVLETQDIFVDILTPLLAEMDAIPFAGAVLPRSYFTKLDQVLSFSPHYVPALAAYVAHSAYPELVYLSVKIMSSLAESSAFTNLAALIEKNSDSERILDGYRRLLEADSTEGVENAATAAEQWTGAGAVDPEVIPASLVQATKLAALDLFIENAQPGRPYPNIAHFLLLGGTSHDHQIEDPHALNARATSIHVIFEAVMTGIPVLKGNRKERNRLSTRHMKPLFVAQPGLAERFYRVVQELCAHPQTSDFAMRYLRTREDFFARQLAAVTFKTPTFEEDPFIEVMYSDGTRVITTAPALCSFLRLRSWIIDMAALELHVLTNKGHKKAASDLLAIVFGHEEYDDGTGTGFGAFNEVGQSHSRVIEFLQSLNFDWLDSVSSEPVKLEFFGQLNLLSCVRPDDTGCEVVDEAAVLSLLADTRRALNVQGRIITPAHIQQLAAETNYVLQSCVAENHRRKVHYAVSAGYESWRRLLDMTLMKCFTQLPPDGRENMLFDLLHALPIAIRSPNVEEGTDVLLSEAILSCITKLREDRKHQIIVQSAGGDVDASALPLERLTALLRNLLDIIVDSNGNEFVRGNLYAALINYQHLVASKTTEPDADMGNLAASLLTSSIQDDSLFGSQMTIVPSTSQKNRHTTTTLNSVSLAVLKGTADRLTAVVARDAIDGSEVWKTVAFMLLDALLHMFRKEPHNYVLTTLVRQGVLSNIVAGIKELDILLQSVLEPEPDDLNPLYVYEAKMSMLMQVAQTRQGAERLLEAQILRVLAQCDFLDARPEQNQAFIDQDSFLPSAIERYHQLFMPALHTVDAILTTLGSQHASASKQTLEFLNSHRETIIILLKNESSTVSLSMVEEIHLLISLCVGVLPLIPKPELLSASSGFGGIHTAVLSLAARGLIAKRWLDNVIPQTDSERRDASTYAPRQNSTTKFQLPIRQRGRMLLRSLVAYLGAASNFTEPEFTLVLSPVTTSSFREDRATQYQSTVPTVDNAIEALNDVYADLSNTLNQIADIAAELANRNHIQLDHVQEILGMSDTEFLDELDLGQKRTLVCRVLENNLGESRRAVNILLTTIEMLTLLLWRHILQYSEGIDIGSLPPKSSLAQSMRFVSAPDGQTFRAEVGRKLGPVLQQLASLEFDSNISSREWRSSRAYIETMTRKLMDITDPPQQIGF
ncbi:hypothetical protein NEOLEDRAFT_1178711 [Neolentinus lepideus HHB14362 ss-1]|uniref:Nucleoporin n=1 Tax=Neolentinus lepideus HHB14362 ss-1 TaxID=1314782 RepID=A0A165SC09_9AGAM|nr:hypothetical protein NEOLEDRAFT_1178711 [Neolentinus lepideus HHB14362 ss-1]